MQGLTTFSLNPLLDLYILLVLSRQVLHAEGKLFFTWTLRWTEAVTDPFLRLAGALRLPGWRSFAAVHGALLLVLVRAVFYALAWAILAVDPPAEVVMGHALFAFRPTHWVAATLFSAGSVVATGILVSGWLFLVHFSVPLSYRHTHLGLLLGRLYAPWERVPPLARLGLWILLYGLVVAVACALPSALLVPAWSSAGVVGSLAQGLALAVSTLHGMLPSLQILLLLAAVLSWLRWRPNPFFDAIAALAEALCAPLRPLRLERAGLDLTYLAMLVGLALVHLLSMPILRLLAAATGVA